KWNGIETFVFTRHFSIFFLPVELLLAHSYMLQTLPDISVWTFPSCY
ncbi:unnamed protein product, partial [Allacma fusca]